MAPLSDAGASVLVVDPDAAIRLLVARVLEHAGFRTEVAETLEDATREAAQFAVIVRDLNLAPRASRRSLGQLAATAPELLRRTVVMTTAPARAATAVREGSVFAIVCKPFDVAELVNAVSACARGSRKADRVSPKRAVSPRAQRRTDDDGSSVKLRSVQRFVSSVPSLQRLLSDPVDCESEASLRTEMRRTLKTLSATLMEAAHDEASRTRAAVFRAASLVAAQLASAQVPVPWTPAGAGDH